MLFNPLPKTDKLQRAVDSDPIVEYFNQECRNSSSLIRKLDLRYMQASLLLCSDICPCNFQQYQQSPYKQYLRLDPRENQFITKIQDCRYYIPSHLDSLANSLESDFQCSGVC